MTKDQFAERMRSLTFPDKTHDGLGRQFTTPEKGSVEDLRWAIAWEKAANEREGYDITTMAEIIIEGRKPLPATMDELIDMLWDEEHSLDIWGDEGAQEISINDFFDTLATDYGIKEGPKQ